MKPWVVVPAAGIGQRFGAETPKQYQSILGKTVLEWSLEKLLALNPQGVVIALHSQDTRWRSLPIMANPLVHTVEGGATRAESVLQALTAIKAQAEFDEWVLVHDAARPCVRVGDMQTLLAQLENHPVGGLLAAPVSDTLKKVTQGAIDHTVSRESLWAAMTPQMFRFNALYTALKRCLHDGLVVTDEASAMEQTGVQPLVIQGSGDNIKITRPEDLLLAETIMGYQQIGE